MKTVLLTGVGCPGNAGTAFCLRNNGSEEVRLVGCDVREWTGTAFVDGVPTQMRN